MRLLATWEIEVVDDAAQGCQDRVRDGPASGGGGCPILPVVATQQPFSEYGSSVI